MVAVTDTRDNIPSLVARTRPVQTDVAAVAAHFLGTTAIFVLGEAALLFVPRSGEVRTIIVKALGSEQAARYREWVESNRQRVHELSQGRAILGLGASGPQVIEGFHGVPYDHPVQRTREIIEICRKVWRREVVEYLLTTEVEAPYNFRPRPGRSYEQERHATAHGGAAAGLGGWGPRRWPRRR